MLKITKMQMHLPPLENYNTCRDTINMANTNALLRFSKSTLNRYNFSCINLEFTITFSYDILQNGV